MANKRNLKDPKNDFAYDEGEVSGFSNETAIVGDLIATFSVNDSSEMFFAIGKCNKMQSFFVTPLHTIFLL